jgi:hypothetical protein
MRARAACLLLAACLCACAPLPRYETRPARSSLGCVRKALDTPRSLPTQDKQAHCLAAGLIARYCSISEAWMASVAKELGDLLGPGDADWGDLAADRRGIRCARQPGSDTALATCCKVEPPL